MASVSSEPGTGSQVGAGIADVIRMESSTSSKRLRLRRADRCLVCDGELPAGHEAIWHRDIKRVTCLACSEGQGLVVGRAGASALREYEERHRRRERHAREVLGGFGVFLSRAFDEPSSTKVWQQGGQGEVRAGALLEKHLDGTAVRLLHDRRIPGRGRANIDHLAVGPGGVTVIDTKTHRGKVRVEQVGGLFAPRRSVLRINGRDRTGLIDGVEGQIDVVRCVLSRAGHHEVDVRGALCFPDVDGIPLFRQLRVRDVAIDGPKPVAKLAARPGPLSDELVSRLWGELARALPPA